jgi:hypothetical protein
MTKKWLGSWPTKCDICKVNLANEPKFIDGRTQEGPWALMCLLCYRLHGVGLGTGKGQKYDSKTLEKVEG